MKLDNKVREALENIFKETGAISIFVYGSRARNDFKKESDYEIGALYLRDKKARRSEIAKLHDIEGMNVYPFVYEDFLNYEIDTPFPKAIYLREIIGAAKTVLGENVIEKMKLPEIRMSNLIERVGFDIATAFAAYRSFKSGDELVAAINFKSTLFGLRLLEILELGKFPYTYDEIVENSKELDLSEEYRELVEHAAMVRKGGKIEERFLFTNISFLSQVVSKKIWEKYKEDGDVAVLE